MAATSILGFAVTRLRRHRTAVVLLSVVLLTGTVLQLLPGLLIRSYLNRMGVPDAPVGAAVSVVVAFVVVSLAVQGLAIGEGYLAERLAWSMTNELRTEVTTHCMRLEMPFHSEHLPGELVERIDGDTTVLSNFFSRFIIAVVGQALLALGLLVALTVLDWRIGASLVPVGVIGFLVLRYLSARGRAAYDTFRGKLTSFSGFAAERLTATEDLAGNGAAPYTLRVARTKLTAVQRSEVDEAMWGSIYLWSAASLLTWLSVAIALLWSWQLYHSGAMTLGTAFLVFTYTVQLTGPLDSLTLQNQDYQAAAASVNRLRRLLDVAPRPPAADPRPFPCGSPAVDLVDVTFGYRPDVPVLHRISFRVPAGTSLGVVGRTGSGKSTLARLITGLYEPSGGAVRIGGLDVAAIAPRELRDALAVVPQEVMVFSASLRDNLTLFGSAWPGGRVGRGDADLVAVLSRLGLGEWLARLPDGLDTRLGTGGHGLSAGEEQLVAFARVMLRRPRVVVLDEATSRVDPVTEQLVRGATATLLRDRTSVVIAHRLSTLDAVDSVLMLEAGRVLEHGRRVDLVADSGSHFSALLRAAASTSSDLIDIAAQPTASAPGSGARDG